jgi:hypothetical protein
MLYSCVFQVDFFFRFASKFNVNFQFSAICDACSVYLIPLKLFTLVIPYLFEGANYGTFRFARGIKNLRHAALQHLNDMTTEK